MPKHSSRSKLIAGALAFSLLAGGTSIAIPAPSAFAAVSNSMFVDTIPAWAQKHVSKLALQGIINGYKTSSGTTEFRPLKSVSQEEAVVMALRFAGLEGEVDPDGIVAYPDSFKVSSYAKPYIIVAFKNGLLDQNDEYANAAANPKAAWGTTPATREWVTKLLVKAIDKKQLADDLSKTASTFADGNQITAKYLGYVNAAVSLDLVKGVSATKFDPKAPVNRASLATLFSRAEKQYKVPYAGQVSGIVTAQTASSITLYSEGKETTYTLDSNTLYYSADSDNAIAAGDIKLYTDVTLIGNSGKALYVETQGTEQHVKTTIAKLDRINTTDRYFYAWVNDEPVKFTYSSAVTVKDSTGKTLQISDLKRDANLTIVQDTFRTAPQVVSITAEAQTGANTVTGQFYSAGSGLINYLVDGTLQSKFLADNVVVVINGIDTPTVSDLLKDVDNIKLTLNDNQQVTRIEVVNRNVSTIESATVVNYSGDNKLLTVFDPATSNANALFLTDSTKIDYSGSSITVSQARSYLVANRKVKITYSGKNIISLSFIYKQTGSLVSVNTTDKLLSVKLDSGEKVSIPYVSPLLQIPGVSVPTIGSLQAGDTVTVLLDANQEKAATIQVHKTLQYQVVSANASTKLVTVKAADNSQKDISLVNVPITDENGNALTVGALTSGTIINVPYIGSNIQSVKTITMKYGTVSSVAASSLTVTEPSGTSSTVTFSKGIKVVKGTQTTYSSSAIAAGDIIQVYKDENEQTIVTVAVGDKRTFWKYDAPNATLWTYKNTSEDNSNFAYITSNTKILYNNASIQVSALKDGDTITVYAFNNTALKIVKS
ncbi:S-layer homology domain-containing protein [Paenibacillus sp. ATY16]|uniref:S-layer homology domain-containing protein n=1 Tax=Paenibacillus sp. ATY16 TaxID=1759312 RepID=UPI00200D57E4|nr:S-layer homology domain-containing protein [Paenibacillus sp. ATY16]MCK9857493.1 S-layer homology domain-containing protein [Paenibacillus sp. ATY16]